MSKFRPCYGWLLIFDGALFLMVCHYQSEAKLPWAGKCISNYVFLTFHSFYPSSFCLFKVANHGLDVLQQEKHQMSVKPYLHVSVFFRGYMIRPSEAVLVKHTEKVKYSPQIQQNNLGQNSLN